MTLTWVKEHNVYDRGVLPWLLTFGVHGDLLQGSEMTIIHLISKSHLANTPSFKYKQGNSKLNLALCQQYFKI